MCPLLLWGLWGLWGRCCLLSLFDPLCQLGRLYQLGRFGPFVRFDP